jgi:Zn-dependent peptidase ImmA (M78 family)
VFLEDEEKETNDREAQADAFASDWLIPESRYRAFRRLGSYTCASASRFAYDLGIAPGIVVGRLQHEGLMDRSQCNNLKKHLEWVFDTQE